MKYVVLMILVLLLLILCCSYQQPRITRIDSSTYIVTIDSNNFNVVTSNEYSAKLVIEKYKGICRGWRIIERVKSGKKYKEYTIFFTEKPVTNKNFRYVNI